MGPRGVPRATRARVRRPTKPPHPSSLRSGTETDGAYRPRSVGKVRGGWGVKFDGLRLQREKNRKEVGDQNVRGLESLFKTHKPRQEMQVGDLFTPPKRTAEIRHRKLAK